jgi:hypothetical protein
MNEDIKGEKKSKTLFMSETGITEKSGESTQIHLIWSRS